MGRRGPGRGKLAAPPRSPPLADAHHTPLLEAPRDEAERSRFAAWCAETTRLYGPRVGAAVVAAIVLWWPSDPIIFAGQPEVWARMAYARGACAAFLTACVIVLPRLEAARRHAQGVVVSVAALASGITAYGLAQVNEAEPFWLAYLYITPLFSIAFLQPFGRRVLSALLIGGAVAAGFLLAPHDALAWPETRAALSYLLFTSLMAAGLGHAVYLLVRSSFLMRLRVDEQRARLGELASRLEERVAEQTDELRQLHRRSNQIGAEQKRLIARDLHDGLGQELSSLRLLVGVGKSLSVEEAPREVFDELEGLVERVQISLRGVLQALRPRLLDEQGLVEGLGTLLADTERRWGLRYTLEIGALPDPCPNAVSVAVFWISQEALHNVVRHAHATALTLRLNRQDAELILEIHDNGRGYGGEAGAGHGVSNIRERAADLGGEATWTRQEGTLLRVRLPLGAG